jgi:peptidoglycan/LPS O-acetylase OafA/YrhL
LPKPLHLPFIVAYGIAQPVLPAAIADPAVWPMRLIGILRGLGWYALLPFLLYSLRSIWKMADKRERMAWLWLWLAVWVWIILASARAGGDQWDNPRYRVILLTFQAALVAQAITWQRATRDRWLGRLLAVEGVFLIFFGYWYAARYTNWRAGQVHIFVVIAAIVIVSAVILVGGWIWDRRRKPAR